MRKAARFARPSTSGPTLSKYPFGAALVLALCQTSPCAQTALNSFVTCTQNARTLAPDFLSEVAFNDSLMNVLRHRASP